MIEGRRVGWYVETISASEIPIWRWDEIDAGDWAVITAVRTAFHAGVEDGRREHRAAAAGRQAG